MAASSVLNSLLTRPSTSIAKPLAGRSVPDLNTGVVVLIRCARCWRMGKLRFQGFASERMKPEMVPVPHRWTATGHGTQSHLFGRCIVAAYQSSDRIGWHPTTFEIGTVAAICRITRNASFQAVDG